MTFWKRVALVLSILIVDTLVFFVPLTACFAAFVILARPKWFIRFVNQTLY